ncbi:hypothetical protein GF412_03530 [Candidatus Micrarchaeota archaeon]|nr:hypothetical protein [Candidatus Micrarchaeota archaeon]MBD3418022.1 hypothetical protein [Candidatus Micrarchaeota archaeon]
MGEKYVLCDASSLISLTSSCLENLLAFFHERFSTRFIIPQSVRYEAVERPLSFKSKIHDFSALRIKDLIQDGIIDVVPGKEEEKTKKLMKLGNSIFFARGNPVKLIHLGETEMLVLSKKLQVNSLLMDERTTRMLVENPISMKNHLQEEFGTNVMVNKKNLLDFTAQLKGLDVIRSTELLYLAYENNFFKHFNKLEKQAAEAALFTLKYSGCAVSFGELKEYSKMIQ